MGSTSMVQFQDLNLYPDPSATKIVPKLEPRLEPLDEPLPPAPPPLPSRLPSPLPLPPICILNFPAFLSCSALPSRKPRGKRRRFSPTRFRPGFAGAGPSSRPESHLSNAIVRGTLKYGQRSAALVRVTDMKSEDQRYYRGLIRKTRILFDSLRVFAVVEDEKIRNGDNGLVLHKRTRGDLRAAALMRERGLWLNRDKRMAGDIPATGWG